MEHKNDIGKHIATKVKEMNKSPKEGLWDQINTTLDIQEKKRKRFILWWIIGAGVGVFSILLLVTNNPFIEENKTINTPQNVFTEEQTRNVKNDETVSSEEELEHTKSLTDDSELTAIDTSTINTEERPLFLKRKETNTPFASKKETSPANTPKKIVETHKNVTINPSEKESQNSEVFTTTKKEYLTEKDKGSSTNQKENSVVLNTNSNTEIEKIENQKKTEILKFPSAAVDTLSIREKIKLKNKQRIDSIKAARDKKRKDFVANEKIPVEDSLPSQKTPWSITAVVAPVYFNLFKENATIDQDLTGNKKIGKINFAFGATVNFEIDEATSLSLGVIATKVGYVTDNIPAASMADRGAIVSYSGLSLGNSVSEEKLVNFINNETSIKLLQEIKYTELPLQMTYKVLGDKLGAHIQGGVSIYLLGDDFIFAENESGEKLRLGEANNLSKVNFSLNAGVGIYYKLSEKFTIESTPTFKYQINTLDKVSYESSSFLFGIYTGIKYKF